MAKKSLKNTYKDVSMVMYFRKNILNFKIIYAI